MEISNETQIRFDDACKEQNIDPAKILHNEAESGSIQRVLNAYAMLIVLAKAARGNWEPDWNNGNQKKWYPWFEFTSKGLVVDGTYFRYNCTSTHVGSRLCFPTQEMARSFAEENLELYNIILSN